MSRSGVVREYQISDFPLKPFDRNGHALAVGDHVKIIDTPDVTFHGFDATARARYSALHGKVMRIAEFDESGYAVFALWYEASGDSEGRVDEPRGVGLVETHDFCFDPRDLEHVSIR
jgi:hypothetical protein